MANPPGGGRSQRYAHRNIQKGGEPVNAEAALSRGKMPHRQALVLAGTLSAGMRNSENRKERNLSCVRGKRE